MNYKHAFLMAAFLLVILSLSSMVYVWFFYSPERCSNFKSIEASITIERASRPVVGLNADTKSLAFGTSSPTSIVQRSMNVNYTHDAQVQVLMNGPLASWVSITPPNFNLPAGESKEVEFTVKVPASAADGTYNGTAIFCFRE